VPRVRERIEKLEREVQDVSEASITVQMVGYPAVSIPVRRLFDPAYHMRPGEAEHYRRTGEMTERASRTIAELREAKTLEELAEMHTRHLLRAVGYPV
jgi:hypothetical protein